MATVIRSNQELNDLANGKELVVNGDFSQGTAGWTALNSATLSIVNGATRVTTLSTYGGIDSTGFSTVVGSTYEVSFDVIIGTSTVITYGVATTSGNVVRNVYDSGLDIPIENAKSFTFIATSALSYLKFYSSNTAGQYTDFDNISVKEIPKVQGENLPDYVATRSNYGFKNHIINGGFDVWQRGMSFVSAVYEDYSADRWLHRRTSGAKDITKSTLGADNALLLTATASGSTFMSIEQKIEGAKQFSGKTVTLSFDALSSVNIDKLINFRVTHDATSTTKAVSYSLVAGVKKRVVVSVTLDDMTSWDVTGSDYLYVFIDTTLPTSGDTYKITKVQLEEGSVATPFEQRPYGLELSLCQRFYETGELYYSGVTSVSYGSGSTYGYRQTKRAIPTVTYGSVTTAGTGFAGTVASTSNQVNSLGYAFITNADGAGTAIVPFTASSEL